MVSLVIFDLDGTLAANTASGPIAEGDVEPLRRAGTREILRRLDVPLWKLPAIGRRMRALKRDHVASIPLFPGAPEMLRALPEAGLTLALVSSDNEDNARRQLGASAAHFSHFACGASLFGKAAKFKSILRRARVTPAQVIAIGDEVRDIEAARAAGIPCGAVTWGYAAPEALAALKPDMVFEHIEDITMRLPYVGALRDI